MATAGRVGDCMPCCPSYRPRRVRAAGSGGELFIPDDLGLSDAEVEVLAGSMNVYMLVSILAAGWLADLLGRGGTLVLANAFLVDGTLAMSLIDSYAALMPACFVTSVGVGFSLAIAPVYNAEISPVSTCGVLSCAHLGA